MGGSAQDSPLAEALGVRAAAFALLLQADEPVEPERLSRLTGLGRARLDEILVEEERRGSLRRDDFGRVVVCGGISLAPTRHRIAFDNRRRFTCYAYDTLGILGASAPTVRSTRLRRRRASGSTSGSSEAGHRNPKACSADDSLCRSALEDWCPNVNLFKDDDSAMRCSARSGIAGRVLRLEEATEMGAQEWSRLIDADPSRSSTGS